MLGRISVREDPIAGRVLEARRGEPHDGAGDDDLSSDAGHQQQGGAGADWDLLSVSSSLVSWTLLGEQDDEGAPSPLHSLPSSGASTPLNALSRAGTADSRAADLILVTGDGQLLPTHRGPAAGETFILQGVSVGSSETTPTASPGDSLGEALSEPRVKPTPIAVAGAAPPVAEAVPGAREARPASLPRMRPRSRSLPHISAGRVMVAAERDDSLTAPGPPLGLVGQLEDAWDALEEERDDLADRLLRTDAQLSAAEAAARRSDGEASAQRALVQQLLAAQAVQIEEQQWAAATTPSTVSHGPRPHGSLFTPGCGPAAVLPGVMRECVQQQCSCVWRTKWSDTAARDVFLLVSSLTLFTTLWWCLKEVNPLCMLGCTSCITLCQLLYRWVDRAAPAPLTRVEKGAPLMTFFRWQDVVAFVCEPGTVHALLRCTYSLVLFAAALSAPWVSFSLFLSRMAVAMAVCVGSVQAYQMVCQDISIWDCVMDALRSVIGWAEEHRWVFRLPPRPYLSVRPPVRWTALTVFKATAFRVALLLLCTQLVAPWLGQRWTRSVPLSPVTHAAVPQLSVPTQASHAHATHLHTYSPTELAPKASCTHSPAGARPSTGAPCADSSMLPAPSSPVAVDKQKVHVPMRAAMLQMAPLPLRAHPTPACQTPAVTPPPAHPLATPSAEQQTRMELRQLQGERALLATRLKTLDVQIQELQAQLTPHRHRHATASSDTGPAPLPILASGGASVHPPTQHSHALRQAILALAPAAVAPLHPHSMAAAPVPLAAAHTPSRQRESAPPLAALEPAPSGMTYQSFARSMERHAGWQRFLTGLQAWQSPSSPSCALFCPVSFGATSCISSDQLSSPYPAPPVAPRRVSDPSTSADRCHAVAVACAQSLPAHRTQPATQPQQQQQPSQSVAPLHPRHGFRNDTLPGAYARQHWFITRTTWLRHALGLISLQRCQPAAGLQTLPASAALPQQGGAAAARAGLSACALQQPLADSCRLLSTGTGAPSSSAGSTGTGAPSSSAGSTGTGAPSSSAGSTGTGAPSSSVGSCSGEQPCYSMPWGNDLSGSPVRLVLAPPWPPLAGESQMSSKQSAGRAMALAGALAASPASSWTRSVVTTSSPLTVRTSRAALFIRRPPVASLPKHKVTPAGPVPALPSTHALKLIRSVVLQSVPAAVTFKALSSRVAALDVAAGSADRPLPRLPPAGLTQTAVVISPSSSPSHVPAVISPPADVFQESAAEQSLMTTPTMIAVLLFHQPTQQDLATAKLAVKRLLHLSLSLRGEGESLRRHCKKHTSACNAVSQDLHTHTRGSQRNVIASRGGAQTTTVVELVRKREHVITDCATAMQGLLKDVDCVDQAHHRLIKVLQSKRKIKHEPLECLHKALAAGHALNRTVGSALMKLEAMAALLQNTPAVHEVAGLRRKRLKHQRDSRGVDGGRRHCHRQDHECDVLRRLDILLQMLKVQLSDSRFRCGRVNRAPLPGVGCALITLKGITEKWQTGVRGTIKVLSGAVGLAT